MYHSEIVTIAAGTRLGGKYELLRQLGEGGMGVVWLARHVDLGNEVAVKVLRASVLGDEEAVTRFKREARAAASLRGPHITRILDVGHHDDGSPFMVMEYLEGCDLGAEIAANGPLPFLEAIDVLLQACEGMAEAHARGVVHRDLKPENIFLARMEGRRIAKILDFGISKFQLDGDLRVTQTQTSFGTPLYMSPEQVRSTKNVDHRTDVWSLGVILYEILTGDPPFLGETPTAVAVAVSIDSYRPILERRPDAPRELEAVLARALEKDPAKRYQSVDELARAVNSLRNIDASASGRVIPPPPTSHQGQAAGHVAVTNTMRVSSIDVPVGGAAQTRSTRSTRLLAGGAILGVGVVLALGFVVIRGSSRGRTRTDDSSGRPSGVSTEQGIVASSADATSPTSSVAPKTNPPELSFDPAPSATGPASNAASAADAPPTSGKSGIPKTSPKPPLAAPEVVHPDSGHPEVVHPDSGHPDALHPDALHPETPPKPKPTERNPQFL